MSNPPSESAATDRTAALLEQQIEQLKAIEVLLHEILKAVRPPSIADTIRKAQALIS